MKKIKTLLIEDSGLMRIMISDALRSDPEIEVVGTAINGKEGAKMARKLHPDVVVTDMLMPDFNGLFAVKEIMSNNPLPIILLSSLGKTTPEIFDALNAGAFDFIDKPQTKNPEDFKNELKKLKDKIKIASGFDSNVLNHQQNKVNTNKHTFDKNSLYHIIAIGSSTGGPRAIELIVKQLPENLMVPVVIVQHMPERFLESFAHRLNTLVPLDIRLAKRNEALKKGTIYITPGTDNYEIGLNEKGEAYFRVSKKTFKEFNNPSVDCMFLSVAEIYGTKGIGIILTGMGKDGSQGLLKMKEKGGLTIAQEGKSCVVNGMPQSAIDIGAIDYVVNLNEIPGFVMSCF
ncbi:chemotaxis-specific protein-glutamate methyltransferase CheB [Fulvivirga sp. 29W222]|uniref:Protein-glutamate methylesterase/protein-glutamine glutaminase n=1 Tax=Fulvivirga marina TaxID=2494733 RepID=A0A937KBK6_9BACT|nr:chemotaxis-specific protein-glutamate methyltransferase CheB [Fulvivirga marina]MBL6447046.1 chemotaxis-specific protein-glutamate methyltransferase CheB [Fulvivirga marina]